MKKLLSIVLVVVMMFSVVSVVANAEDSALVFTGSSRITLSNKCTFNPDNFSVSLSIDEKKIAAFDGESDDFTYEITSIRTPDGIDYNTDPEAFFAHYTAEDFAGSALEIDFEVKFASEAVFGELEYTVVVKGFSAPIDLGGIGGLLGGATDDVNANLPTDMTDSGIIEGFPSIDPSTVTLLSGASKISYTDAEAFNPNGVKISLALDNGKSGTLTYNEETAHAFTFVPTTGENLSVYDSEVAMLVYGTIIGYTPIIVEHKWSEGYVNITTDKFTYGKPGYHAIVCEGCGETHDAQPHTYDDEAWIYNNDETFVANGTESNTCLDCGTVLIRDTFGTAGFNTTFADMHFIKVIFEYINVLLRFIGAATY